MKIQFIPQIYTAKNNPQLKQNNNNSNNTEIKNMSYSPIAYQDYNISFGARTPEDFYEFNAQSMPYSMQNYLNYNKEERKNIPPEQMMFEVFKHLDKAENFEEVKTKYYPNEDLFKTLHPLKINSRKGILSEIKVARDLSSTPLLKDGSDDFGMYLLKKIYKEGKTLKEISKDFLEKDINPEYKGFITAPVTYDTTSAYGIKFPNNGFWHSFIATREEYKKFFVTLPKNMVDPNRVEASGSKSSNRTASANGNNNEITTKRAPRKYRLQNYRKNQIKNDIKTGNADIESVEKAVRRRFSKNDPEASFLIKYLSPIMTIAADKVHLSEEMRYFFESEENNLSSNKSKMERFWRTNSELLENYSTAITDTMELFENVFGGGGLIPINSDYEPITSKSEKQTPIDFVNSEFMELLNFTQQIKPTRDARYAKHEEEQKMWEEHFLERYGEVKENEEIISSNISELDEAKVDLTVQEALEKSQKANPNTKIYEFMLEDGTKVSLAVNFRDILNKEFTREYANLPKCYINKYLKFLMNHSQVSENLLLSYIANVQNLLINSNFISDSDNYSDEERQSLNLQAINEIKSQLLPGNEVIDTLYDLRKEFEEANPQFIKRVRHAMMEYSTSLPIPNEDYLKDLVKEKLREIEEAGFIENNTQEQHLKSLTTLYETVIGTLNDMKDHTIAYMDTGNLESGLSFLSISNDTENKTTKLDKIMQKYQKPLSNSERTKITRVLMDSILKLDPYSTKAFGEPQIAAFYKTCTEVLKKKESNKIRREISNLISEQVTTDNTTLRYIIEPQADKNLREAIIEREISNLIHENISVFKMVASVDAEILEQYIKATDMNLYRQLSLMNKNM